MGRNRGDLEARRALTSVLTMMQNEHMANDAAITIRIPSSLKRRLEARAKEQHRSLSAQVAADLESVLDSVSPSGVKGRFLGLYEGTAVPTDDDIEEVRRLLWGNMSRLEERA